jgi:hypothetical protein
MDWKEVFDNLDSSYDIGMRADLKEYLQSRFCYLHVCFGGVLFFI